MANPAPSLVWPCCQHDTDKLMVLATNYWEHLYKRHNKHQLSYVRSSVSACLGFLPIIMASR